MLQFEDRIYKSSRTRPHYHETVKNIFGYAFNVCKWKLISSSIDSLDYIFSKGKNNVIDIRRPPTIEQLHSILPNEPANFKEKIHREWLEIDSLIEKIKANFLEEGTDQPSHKISLPQDLFEVQMTNFLNAFQKPFD